ncbi:hypothetical protein [Streptomyces sp. UG1]|uniref:hypothetical protein n=1 Tax=Streptomyces sp. UG1 TaxID=3417652 RepID=UPI003CEE63BE
MSVGHHSSAEREELEGREDVAAGYQPCEHRQIEQRDGKTHCRDCERQLYL